MTTLVYWPGLHGGWLFDDYPNIVDNHGVQPKDVSLPSLVQVALSSPASDFKRPLASLSFALNYLAGGLDPFGWKLFNLLIHLLNGLGVFVLARQLLKLCASHERIAGAGLLVDAPGTSAIQDAGGQGNQKTDYMAAWLAAAWLLLPINLTAVLYVVQREESIANLFVLLGLIGYVSGRQRMLSQTDGRPFLQCLTSLTLPLAMGVLAKETAIMLPLYALLVEWIVFKFQAPATDEVDKRITALYVLVLVIPLVIGMSWLGPRLLRPEAWATRDFTLGTRLLSEARAICDYIVWILIPTPEALSFYHDDFVASPNLFSPWTTLPSLAMLAGLAWFAYASRRRRPLAAVGVGLYLGSHLLTGTIVPLELIYEHRNYFGSFGILLAAMSLLMTPRVGSTLYRRPILVALLISWTSLTAYTAFAWGTPLRLAEELANRAPNSPRAQYELGRTYVIYSQYDPASPYASLAYPPLERAAAMPKSSILPQQALIFMSSRMHLPQKDQWWDSMIDKLRARPPGVQDESSLVALTQCAKDGGCALNTDRMTQAFQAATGHPNTSGRLLAAYGDYVWNLQGDRRLGEQLLDAAVEASPNEPAYRITQIRMLIAQGRYAEARASLSILRTFNIGGHLDSNIASLDALLSQHQEDTGPT